MEKHFFGGSNTSKGFYSYFDYIVNVEKADRFYIIKGGPGVGKSSFMKKIARFFHEKGANIDYVHCSTDSNSLDGIYVQEYKFAMVDGTAPHAIEPRLPGLVDEILDFGKYLDRNQLLNDREKIIEIGKEKSKCYQSGYQYLEMAGIILNEISKKYLNVTNRSKQYIIEVELLSNLDNLLGNIKPAGRAGNIRKMFSDSYTPAGYVSFVDQIAKGKKVWEIVSPNYIHLAETLDRIVTNVIIKGLNVDGYYHPLFPEKLQHIYIRELNLMIMSVDRDRPQSFQSQKDSKKQNKIQSEKIKIDKSYPFYESIENEKLSINKSELESNKELFDLLLIKGMGKFNEAKSKHEILEKIYINSMDFSKVDALYDKIILDYI